MTERDNPTQSAYDRVADEYAARMADELAHKPFDRAILDELAARVGDLGPICDLGCGPGQVARYLHDRGVAVCGIDLSPAMVVEAGRLHPGIPFSQGDILDLSGVADGAFGGVAAFYSIIHVAPDLLPVALREITRILRSGGTLLLTFHLGDETRHLDEWWGRTVSLDFHFYSVEAMVAALQVAGFTGCEVRERGPCEGVEVATNRAYVFVSQGDERALN